MYRTLIIIGKISHDRANRTPNRSRDVLFRPEGAYIFNNDRQRSIHYPAYYMATCQNDNCLLPAFVVLNSRGILCQRRWRHLATIYTGSDKLLDHLRSDTKDMNHAWIMMHTIHFPSNYQKIIDRRKLGRPIKLSNCNTTSTKSSCFCFICVS